MTQKFYEEWPFSAIENIVCIIILFLVKFDLNVENEVIR